MKCGELLFSSTLGKFWKIGDLRGIVDVRFDLVARLAAQLAHQRVEHAEHIEIVPAAWVPHP